MDYIDKINKNNIDYQIKDSSAARSVEGDTSHVQEANEIYTTTSQSQTDAFSYRTSAGAMSINSGVATISTVYGNTVQTGHTDEVLTVTGNFQTEGTTVELNKDTFRALELENGTYNFDYDGTWKLAGATVTLADYGLTVTGTVVSGDSISVEYVALVIGNLTTATPTAFKATGYNQYNATAGYAHVVGGNQYRVAGTYTAVEFATTPTGEKTTVTVVDDKFTPEEDGYIFVTGTGDILVALVWSGTMDSEPWSAYEDNGFNVPTTDADGNNLPTATYGFPSVHGVRDEIDFAGKLYQQRIGHYAYSVENLATVEALGVDFVYDLNDIFYVLPDLVVYELASAVSGVYEVNDYGTEEWVGTNVPLTTVITYGNSLVDKLRNLADIQSIGEGLTLGTNGELSAEGGVNVVQDIGSSITDVMSQDAITNLLFRPISNAQPNKNNIFVQMGSQITTTTSAYNGHIAIGGSMNLGQYAIGIMPFINQGYSQTQVGSNSIMINTGISPNSSNVSGLYAVAIGANLKATQRGCVAIGDGANATVQGQFDISATNEHYSGYNNSTYRLLTGLYDGQSAHDAATYGQLDARLRVLNAAPTEATAGTLGQLVSVVTAGDVGVYVLTAIDNTDPTDVKYTWKKLAFVTGGGGADVDPTENAMTVPENTPIEDGEIDMTDTGADIENNAIII